MHGTVKLVGPGLIVFVVLAVLIWAGSAFVTIDAARRRSTDFTGVGEGRWFYLVPQAAFFLAFLAWQVPFVQTVAPWIGSMVLVIPFILAQQMAFLLRVVFPTRKRLEKRLEAERLAERKRRAAEGPVELDAGFYDPDEEDALSELDEPVEPSDEQRGASPTAG